MIKSLYNYLMTPVCLPYNFDEWKALPFSERAKKVCQAWALQGFGSPPFVILFYSLKTAFYVYIWFFFCSFSTNLSNHSDNFWFLNIDAFYKAVFWTIFFEAVGMGGSSGPLTAKYMPPIGGMLYFLRPNTIKIPLFPNLPIIGGDKRNFLDVTLYATLLFFLMKICTSSVIEPNLILVVLVLLLVLGIFDRTIFLAARADMYLPVACCFLFPSETIPALKIVWFAIWFWAAFSKLTPSFTSVVCVMICNSPVLKLDWLKKILFKNYPDDLRPSKSAAYMSHFGTLIEFIIPIILISSSNPTVLFYSLIIITCFHAFIFINFPMAVPLEWNIMMVFGAWFLFGHSYQASIFHINNPFLITFFVIMFIILPIIGNLFPKYVSFLLSMRYYAGTWAYSIWLFKGNSIEKMEKNITKTSADLLKQLGLFYDKTTCEGILSRVIAFRMMHLPSRALHDLLPKTVENINDYRWMDGEMIASEVLGWNFGDGHLHAEPLLASIQKRCNFESGELRCIMVESPSLHKQAMEWRIYDAHDGLIENGSSNLKTLKNKMPWSI